MKLDDQKGEGHHLSMGGHAMEVNTYLIPIKGDVSAIAYNIHHLYLVCIKRKLELALFRVVRREKLHPFVYFMLGKGFVFVGIALCDEARIFDLLSEFIR